MCGSRDLGEVSRIICPVQLDNGEVSDELVWEARTPGQVGEVNPYSYPVFRTRAEAVAYLAEEW